MRIRGFPLKKVNAPLHQSREQRIALSIRETMYAAVLWCVINVVMDYPIFAYGPMKMHVGAYYSEIGLVYLVYPLFGFWASRLAARRANGHGEVLWARH